MISCFQCKGKQARFYCCREDEAVCLSCSINKCKYCGKMRNTKLCNKGQNLGEEKEYKKTKPRNAKNQWGEEVGEIGLVSRFKTDKLYSEEIKEVDGVFQNNVRTLLLERQCAKCGRIRDEREVGDKRKICSQCISKENIDNTKGQIQKRQGKHRSLLEQQKGEVSDEVRKIKQLRQKLSYKMKEEKNIKNTPEKIGFQKETYQKKQKTQQILSAEKKISYFDDFQQQRQYKIKSPEKKEQDKDNKHIGYQQSLECHRCNVKISEVNKIAFLLNEIIVCKYCFLINDARTKQIIKVGIQNAKNQLQRNQIEEKKIIKGSAYEKKQQQVGGLTQSTIEKNKKQNFDYKDEKLKNHTKLFQFSQSRVPIEEIKNKNIYQNQGGVNEQMKGNCKVDIKQQNNNQQFNINSINKSIIQKSDVKVDKKQVKTSIAKNKQTKQKKQQFQDGIKKQKKYFDIKQQKEYLFNDTTKIEIKLNFNQKAFLQCFQCLVKMTQQNALVVELQKNKRKETVQLRHNQKEQIVFCKACFYKQTFFKIQLDKTKNAEQSKKRSSTNAKYSNAGNKDLNSYNHKLNATVVNKPKKLCASCRKIEVFNNELCYSCIYASNNKKSQQAKYCVHKNLQRGCQECKRHRS